MTETVLSIAKDIIMEAMSHVTSADKAFRYLLETGYKFTREAVRKAWREYGVKDYWATVSNTYGVNRTIPKAWYVERETQSGIGFEQVIRVFTIDPETGKITSELHDVSLDKPLTYSKLWSRIKEDVMDSLEVKGQLLLDWKPAGIIKHIPKK